MLLGADALTSLEKGGEITVRSLGLIWSILNPASLAAFKDWAQHYLPFLAQSIYSALAMPGWGLIGVVGSPDCVYLRPQTRRRIGGAFF